MSKGLWLVVPLALLAPMRAVSKKPLDKAAAKSKAAELTQLYQFTSSFQDWAVTEGLDSCKANAAAFKTQCTDKNVQSSACKVQVCSVNSTLNATGCTAQGGSMNEQELKNRCCEGGSVKCEYDDDGNKLDFSALGRCCGLCNNASHPHQARCTTGYMKSAMTLAVCGTTKGYCYQCKAGNLTFHVSSESDCTSNWGECNAGGVVSATNEASCQNTGTCTGCGSATCSSDRGACLNSGTCQGHASGDQTACTSGGGTWTQATFSQATWTRASWNKTSATTRAQCEEDDRCYKCKGPCEAKNNCPGDKKSCETQGSCTGCGQHCAAATTKSNCLNRGTCTAGNNPADSAACTSAGGTWTPAKWTPNVWTVLVGATNDNCHGDFKGSWVKQTYWQRGNELPTPPMPTGRTCSTGPEHSEPSHILPTDCMDHAKFIADAANGSTVATAVAADAAYYKKLKKYLLSGAYVVNAPNAMDRSQFTLSSSACFVGLMQPLNMGGVTIQGGAKTYALVLAPNNTKEADPLRVLGSGTAVVLGGTSAGKIVVNTSGTMLVYGLTNSGDVTVVRADEPIVISDVTSMAGARIEATDAVVTFISVANAGTVTGKGSSGSYAAYDIVNTGTINIMAGTVDLHLKCNTGGTVTASAGVKGTISYDGAACKGTITAPSEVRVRQLPASAATVTKVTGALTLTGLTLTQVTGISASIQESLASNLGVAAGKVKILGFEQVRRRLFDGDGRLLSGTGVKVNYEVTTKDTATALKLAAKVTQPAMQSSFLTKLKDLEKNNAAISAALQSATVAFSAPKTATVKEVAASFSMPLRYGAAVLALALWAVASL